MFCVVKNFFPSLSLETKASLLWKKETKPRLITKGKKLQSAWVAQSPIKLTKDYVEFWIQFCNFSVKFAIYIVCPSVSNFNNLKPQKT